MLHDTISQRRFLAQHSVAILLWHCFEWLQHCSNIATLCWAKNSRCHAIVPCNITLSFLFLSQGLKGDVTRDDLQERFLAQHRVAMLEQCCNHSKQCPNNVATMFCESYRATSPKHQLFFFNEVHIEKCLSFGVFVRVIISRVRGLIECFRGWCSHQQRKCRHPR